MIHSDVMDEAFMDRLARQTVPFSLMVADSYGLDFRAIVDRTKDVEGRKDTEWHVSYTNRDKVIAYEQEFLVRD